MFRLLTVLVMALTTACQDLPVVIVTPTPTSTSTPTPFPTEPPNTRIQWTTSPVTTTSTGTRVFRGVMTNNDDRWSVVNIVVELRLLDGNAQLVQRLTGTVRDLGPGDRGDYLITVPANTRYELTDIHATWHWRLP